MGIAAEHPLNELNELREKHGARPLEPNSDLDMVAAKHAMWMARNGLSHNEGVGDVFMRLDKAGLVWRAAAENIGVGDSMAEVLKEWWNDKPHKQNMLDNYEFGSIYYAVGADNVKYWVLDLMTEDNDEKAPLPTKAE